MLLGDNPAYPDPGGRGGLGDSYERVLATVGNFRGSHQFAEDKSSSIELELGSLTLTNCNPGPQAMNYFEPDAQMILRCSSATKQKLTCPLLKVDARARPPASSKGCKVSVYDFFQVLICPGQPYILEVQITMTLQLFSPDTLAMRMKVGIKKVRGHECYLIKRFEGRSQAVKSLQRGKARKGFHKAT